MSGSWLIEVGCPVFAVALAAGRAAFTRARGWVQKKKQRESNHIGASCVSCDISVFKQRLLPNTSRHSRIWPELRQRFVFPRLTVSFPR